ncbi:MAG TPA: malto-oligosyltrehalose synthase [Desulfuromonadaceae bacterium]|jgi:(1->4)-alpha-D-glucan 1-alpha-D-glucosylmutase
MAQEALPIARIPTASYRLQFNRQFPFSFAKEIIGYLHDLGISDLYASSYLAAKEGSQHGYDIVNHSILNKEIGDEQTYQALIDELQRFGMGQILDFVPNHMCIESNENLWWMDVLENGPGSSYARFFDIDWRPVKKELNNQVLLPLLADQYGKVLEKGDLRLVFAQGAFWITVNDLQIPIEPKTYLHILGHGLESLLQELPEEDPSLLELLSIITTLQHLPPAIEQDLEKKAERYREKELVKKHLRQLCDQSPEITGYIDKNVNIFNGSKGDPRSFDLLDGLLQEQSYRLSYWQVATEEINYRRFFDINGLAAIRMEDPLVFKETHGLLFRLIQEGKVTGIRLDHVDGLYDPFSYLHDLQKGCFIRQILPVTPPDQREHEAEEIEYCLQQYQEQLKRKPGYKPFYVACEKILMKGEQLPEEWPVFGTTGYDFLNYLNGIFVDTENAKSFARIYDRFVGKAVDLTEVVYEKKKLVLQVALSGELNMLADQLNTISEQDRLTRDFTQNSLARAISEVIAFFPVYRTYVNTGLVREKDSQYIESAVAKAKRRNPAISVSIFDFLRCVLLLKFPEHTKEEVKGHWLNFAMKFQQITGPVMAKGLEDTAFYVYNRLISLNEVGGNPGRFGTPLEAFHGQNLERYKFFPHAMITSATHDTKRGEDARTRIAVLSEIPEKWRKALTRWSRVNKRHFKTVDNQKVPDRNEEYLLYQALIGAWPLHKLDQEGLELFRSRIREYMLKAVREAKVNTSWINPNSAYEEALVGFIDAILGDLPDNLFLHEFIPFQRQISHHGIFNSLSQTLLKMASPGFPDFYQGTELWDFSLVDPDNRRPVDYSSRSQALTALKEREAAIGPQALMDELLSSRDDGRIKLYLIFRCLNYRRMNREIFEKGEYQPLEAHGAKARHVCAFARRAPGKTVIAVAARLLATLTTEPEQVPLGEQCWSDTFLTLLKGSSNHYRNIITEQIINAAEHQGEMRISLAELFTCAPVALLETVG